MPEVKYHHVGDSDYEVVIDGAVVGHVWREWSRHSGIGRARLAPHRPSFDSHGYVWKCDPKGADLARDELETIRRKITRDKISRKTATAHLLDAYVAVGVSFPSAVSDTQAS